MNYHTIKVAEICDNTKTRAQGVILHREIEKHLRINMGVKIDFSDCHNIEPPFIKSSLNAIDEWYGGDIWWYEIKVIGSKNNIYDLLNMGTI